MRGWRAIRASACARAGGGSTESTQPRSTAARGIALKRADVSSWAKVKPPSALIACIPNAPSEPVPDKITPMAWPPASSANEWSRSSTGIGGCCV